MYDKMTGLCVVPNVRIVVGRRYQCSIAGNIAYLMSDDGPAF